MPLPTIETPKYELTVPSTNQKIEYRPYLVKEEKILVLAMESRDHKHMIRAIRDIIDACTFNKLDVENLRMYDLEYIFLKLRSVSVGSISNILMPCSKCETSNEVEVNLENIEIKNNEAKEKNIRLTDKVGMVMKPPTVKGMMRSEVTGDDQYEFIIGSVIACIDSIYDADTVYDASDVTQQELRDFVESLSQEQFNKVNEFFEATPTLSYGASFDCNSCGTHNERDIQGLQNFF